MTTKSFVLNGAALAALLLAGTPAFAQYAGNPPQVSTPAEREQTQSLNQQNADGTYQTPGELNGEEQDQSGPPPSDAGAQYNDQREQYERQRAQYDQSQQRYQEQQDRYQAQRHRYIRDLRRYDLARYEWTDYPRVFFSFGAHVLFYGR